jgi:hypothetical protein
VWLFGRTSLLKGPPDLAEITRAYPNAHLVGGSTSGAICGIQVCDESLVATAVRVAHTQLQGTRIKIRDVGRSFVTGERLAQSLAKAALVHVFVLSDGRHVNGSELVAGLTRQLPPHVTVTGGRAGDGARFQETRVCWDGAPEPQVIVALGCYGSQLEVG